MDIYFYGQFRDEGRISTYRLENIISSQQLTTIMAKYSTGSSDTSSDGDACELCGKSDRDLQVTTVAGAKLLVCNSCRSYEDSSDGSDKNNNSSTNETSQNDNEPVKSGPEGTGYTINRTDSDWVENTRPQYQKEDTPYLVNKYGTVIEKAIEETESSVQEFTAESEAPEDEIRYLLEGDAFSEGVSRATVEQLEHELEIKLIDE